MKKLVALILALALVLTGAVALAERMPESQPSSGWVPTFTDWTPNFDGTHKNAWGQAKACEYEEVTYGNTTIKACPVCGDFNGEKIALCDDKNLQFNRLYDVVKAAKVGMDPASQITGNCDGVYDDGSADGLCKDGIVRNYAYLTNGQYMVRILKMPADSDVAYAVTICHEINGVAYDAEATFSYVLPLDGTGLTVKKAYFGSARDIKCETKVTNDGFYFKPYARENAFGLFLLVK